MFFALNAHILEVIFYEGEYNLFVCGFCFYLETFN